MKPEIFDIFLITGQSNAEGAGDSKKDPETLKENSMATEPGTAYFMAVNGDGSMEEPFDLSNGRRGFSPALAKRWYELTGRGVYVIQTAISGSPIQRWEKVDENTRSYLRNTVNSYNFVKSKTEFKFGDTYYFWCQGETGQAHEWDVDHWIMPGVHLIDTPTYYKKLVSYHEGLMEQIDLKAGVIMLVRTLPRISTKKSLELGLLTDLNPAKCSQYTLHAEYGDSVRILSRICDVARMETTPGPGSGFMHDDNVHYRKKAYNIVGKEMAENLYTWMNPETDNTPTELEWIAPDGRTRMTDGFVLEVDALRGAYTSAMVLPFWASDPTYSFSVDNDETGSVSVDKFGRVTFKEGTPVGTEATLRLTAGYGKSIVIKAVCTEPLPFVEQGKGVVTDFVWNFEKGNLLEYNQYNNLSLDWGDKSNFVPEGLIPHCGLIPEKKLFTSDAYDWSVSWRGIFPGATKLFEGGASRLDTCFRDEKGTYLRYVSSEGCEFRFYYEKPSDFEEFTLKYSASAKTFTLSDDEGVVAESSSEKPFSSCFDLILDGTNSTIAEIKVTMFIEQ